MARSRVIISTAAFALTVFSTEAQATSVEKFTCTLTKYIESIDGTMQARDRQKIAEKDLPSSGQNVAFEKEVTDVSVNEADRKKFRVQAKLVRDRGKWAIEQKLFQVLKEGEREGEEIAASSGKSTVVEVLRTFEQVHQGVPKVEFRLNCLVKTPSVDAPVVATTNIDGSGSGVRVGLPGEEKVANLVIPYAANYAKSDPKLDPKLFNRIVDPEPKKIPPAPVAVGSATVAGAKPSKLDFPVVPIWKRVISFFGVKSEEAPKREIDPESVALKNLVDQDDSFRPAARRAGRSSIPKSVPLVLAPQVLEKAVDREVLALKNMVDQDESFRKPASAAQPNPLAQAVRPTEILTPKTVIPKSVPLVLAPRALEKAVARAQGLPIPEPARSIASTAPKVWQAKPVAESHPGFFGPPSPPKKK